MKYSIIIPVYNAERYLKECLESCIAQYQGQFELVCVNDGSIDHSSEILHTYASKYPFIQVIDKENEGVSVARNVGVASAKGEYIVFLDSDDMLEEHCLEMLDKIIGNKEYDMLIGRVRVSVNERGEYATVNNLKDLVNGESVEKAAAHFIASYDNLGIWAVWRHVYRRRFLVENHLEFDRRYSFAEDMDFLVKAVLCMKSYTLLDFPLLVYRIHSASVSGQYSLKSALSNLYVVSYWREYLAQSKVDQKEKMVSYFANKQIAMLPHVQHLRKEELAIFFKEYRAHSKYLNTAKGKFKAVYVASKVVGVESISQWLGR
ncbi:MAG: glycosyltransferase [Erysipelotrichales bacterium]|nr:glycosyltransferase [Erysipelotrichales bacterium]